MISFMAHPPSRAHNLCSSLYSKFRKEGCRTILIILFTFALSCLFFSPICAAQSGYEIRNAIVTPEYGYEDFTYSAEVWMSQNVADDVGVIAVTQFSLELNIYNNGNLIHTDSIDQRGMAKNSFSFGPYSFKNRFAIEETENASFEFIFYAAGRAVASTKRIPGPIVKPPTATGVQFDRTPYFFQGISASAGFRDQDALDPRPTCHLVITGPLGTAESRTWNSEDVSCRSSGKSAYAATIHEDLSSYRSGGNFSFTLIYNNLKMEPLTYGPYNITLRPYTPAAESLKIDKNLDYTNFTIQATARDASAGMEESLPQGRLIISHPGRDDMIFASLDPQISGDRAVFRWTAENDPPLFNRSDVDLSKSALFSARLEYTNQRWDFSASSSNVTFNVVEEIPKLISPSIPQNVYVSSGETTTQDMTAIVAFSKGPGDLEVELDGPNMDFKSREKATALGGNRYQYRWQIQFDDSHVNNNYTLSLSFLHDQLEGGRYDFDERSIIVSPISVRFLGADVSAASGAWNDSYNYSASIDSTVPVKVQLQVYDPCSSDWIEKQTQEAAVGTATNLYWPLRPFAYECPEMAGKAAKYRFIASFAGEEIASSRAYSGPSFLGAKPTLVSLTPEGDPILVYASEEGGSSSISATVEYGAGQGQAIVRLMEPDGRARMEESSPGIALGGDRYRYDWSLPFDKEDADKSYNLSLVYVHNTLSDEYPLAERTVTVLPVAIDFGAGKVSAARGRWNETFLYSVPVSTSVDATVNLEVYNPCSHAWVERGSAKVSAGETLINISAQPFRRECSDADGEEASYRFTAAFADKTFESEVYSGPMISGGQPRLMSVDFEPVLLVSKDAPEYQSVRATVDFPQGQDEMQIRILGPDGTSNMEEMKGIYLGGSGYLYTWTGEFGAEDIGNYSFSLRNANPRKAGGEIDFTGNMQVVLEQFNELKPKAVGDVSYLPVLFVTEEKGASQQFRAEVFSPGGQGSMMLKLIGEDKDKEAEMTVSDIGAGRYKYDYAEPFQASHAGNSYMFSLDYQLGGKSYSLFNDHIMQVALEGTEPEAIWEPKLILEYDPTLYVPEGGRADQLIHATINYTQGGGILKLRLNGPDQNFSQDLVDKEIGVDSYLYQASVPFDEKHIGNNYTISLAFNHSILGSDFRFADRYMRVLRKEAPSSQADSSGPGNGGDINRVFNVPNVTVIGNVTPAIGVIQAWDEKDPLHALTYTLELQNWSSPQVPWIELSVRASGHNQPWKIVGEKKRFDPSTGSVSWTLKPFWETPFLGRAEYRFIIDGAETKEFLGPEIIAVLSKAADSINGRIHNFEVTANSSQNLTVCLVGGDSRLPENIKSWKTISQCQDYRNGSGEKTYKWQIPETQAPPYYDFDIKIRNEEPLL